jgi:tetratricopeptide (TPR) repeat protein
MLSVIVAVATAAVLFLAGFFAFDVWSGVVIGVIAGIGTLVLLLRRGRKPLEAAMKETEAHMKSQRFDRALAALEGLRPLARWQPGLSGSIDAQIGMIRYAHMREFEQARASLEKASTKIWQAQAMLAAAHFKKERYAEMRTVFERAVKANKKSPLLWLVYGYCEWKRGLRTEALAVLTRGATENPGDERLRNQRDAISNGKKMKMPNNDPEWLALHLERNSVPTGPAARPRYLPPAHRVGARYTRG